MTTLADRSPVSWDWTHPTNLFWRSQRSVHEKERVERRCGEEEWDEGEEGRGGCAAWWRLSLDHAALHLILSRLTPARLAATSARAVVRVLYSAHFAVICYEYTWLQKQKQKQSRGQVIGRVIQAPPSIAIALPPSPLRLTTTNLCQSLSISISPLWPTSLRLPNAKP